MSKSVKIGAFVCSVAAVIGAVMTNYSDKIRTTETGLAIIGNAEGCRRDPYKCPADVLTVGIGSTEASGQKIEKNRKYSDLEIAERWVKDIQIAEKCVNLYGNGRNLPQGAFEAMTSITFNVGCGKMKKSTLFKMANRGYSPEMCQQFERWVYAGGKKLNGLATRREQERRLCLGG
ncbi:lysozyme [Mannheimia pernigra]|uniref:lysozyme n=1 Tax=Mannheimia pernigra TaxID=111844 RepID=UPI00159F4152|nr:lysozyme [Mannheimia pernigra]QLB44718.1 lysozyme [Mannheimia pernigra]